MDAVIISLATGLGVQNAIGWFAPVYFGVVNVLTLLLSLFYYADKSSELNASIQQRQSGKKNPIETNYDLIVVGAGSAGSIVAARLSKHFKVLLLERGGEPNPLITVPGLQDSFLGRREVDYYYETVPQNNSFLACVNQKTYSTAGLGLGGGSIINGMIYIRGHPYDYDRWAEVAQDERWNYENLLPYLERSEGLCMDCEESVDVKPSVNPMYHNRDGELPIRPLPLSPLVPEFLQALDWAGVEKGDMNAPYYKEIADTHIYNHRNSRRVTTYEAFVTPNLGESLQVVKYARVIQILFEPGTNRAVGVKYERFGEIEEVRASKEVILSAGALDTPKLLMLSGIGPQKDLKRLQIPLRCNLPVGKFLQNHATNYIGPFLIDQPLSLLPERVMNESAVDAYLQNGTGPFSVMFAHAHTMWRSNKAPRKSVEAKWPDVLVRMAAFGVGQGIDETLVRQHNFRADLLQEFLGPLKGKEAFNFYVNLGRPKSMGSVRLRSKNYLDDPLFDPRFYSDPKNEDAEATVRGIQRAVHMAENAPSFQRLGAKLSPIPFPSCKHLPHRSREYWHCYIRHFTMAMHHFSGTTAMGKVVDSELRVIGTSGLRVIDAGVMPFITTANTYATVMAIGERGADFVMDSYLNK